MTEDVLITIKGYHNIDGEDQEPVITCARGKYAFRNGHHLVRFTEEMQEEAGEKAKPIQKKEGDRYGEPSSGTRSLVKFSEKYLCVTRKGIVTNRMEFEEGKRKFTRYQTPAGEIEFEVEAESIAYEEDSRHLQIQVDYALHSGGSRIQDSRVVVRVQPYPFL